MDKTVKDTLLARVYDVAIESPLQLAPKLCREAGCEVFLKREDLQPVHSFKLRGAYNKIARLTPAEKKRGVIAASAGNHAQGVALSAKRLGLKATIVMPRTTPPIKVAAVRSHGAEIKLTGDNFSEAYAYTMQLIEKHGQTLIHPFDDLTVIAGQGTIGREILEQAPDVTHIFVPVGGGGLLAGIAQYVKRLKPKVKVIGVEPEDSNAMGRSLRARKRITLDHVGIFADGVAVKQVGKHTFRIAQKHVDDVITVTNDQICAAIKAVFEQTRSIVEPAGALATAGMQQSSLSKSSRAVAITSGANMTFERLQFVTERTLVGSGKEALFAVEMPERPGALQDFCEKVVKRHSITEFSYRLNRRDTAHIFVGVSVSDETDKKQFRQMMRSHGYRNHDISTDDIAKQHVRHMIGGKSEQAKSEHLYEITFPERPGALADFLKAVGHKWNMSLFHYRGQGGDTGSVMIGFESSEVNKLENKLKSVGFNFKRADSTSVQLFIGSSE